MGMYRKRPDTKHPKRKIKEKELVTARDEITRIVGKFRKSNFLEMERRSQESALPDGYPSGGGGDGSKSSDDTSSTERTALRLISGEHSGDRTLEAMRSIRNSFDKAWDHVIDAEDAWDAIMASDRQKKDREVTLKTCQACLRDDVPNVDDDRIRAGYCRGCYRDWLETRDESGVRMDRLTFERSRRELVMVDEAATS